jgi:hypothetical protein
MAPQGAHRLISRVEQLQNAATQQQALALELRKLVKWQRELNELWEIPGGELLAREAHSIGRGLQEMSTRLIELEAQAMEMIAGILSESTPDLGS